MTSGSYSFEPELLGPTPRPIPDRVQQGWRARKQRLTVRWLAAIGLVCGLIGSLPAIDAWSIYLPFLPYVFWIGAVLLATAVGISLWERFGIVPTRYIRDGVPVETTVVWLGSVPALAQYGQVMRYRFQANVEYDHPATGLPTQTEFLSADFLSDDLEFFDVTYRVGEPATAVYLPGDPDKSIRLYGFLDLMPDVGLIRGDASARRRKQLLAGLAIALIISIPLVSLLVTALYSPLDYTNSELVVPFVLGLVILGGSTLFGFAKLHQKEVRDQAQRNLEAAATGKSVQVGNPSLFAQTGIKARFFQTLTVIGSLFFGGILGVSVAFGLNGWLDESAPVAMPVEVIEVYEENHFFLLRLFYLEYRRSDVDEKHKLYTRPEALEPFFFNREAIAQVRAGRFGWPWVERLDPILPDPDALAADPGSDLSGTEPE